MLREPLQEIDQKHLRKSYFITISALDVISRLLPNISWLKSDLILPAILVFSGVAIEWSTISWALGWILFSSVVFQISPLLFPLRFREWAHGLISRVFVSLNVLILGPIVEHYIAALTGIGPTPVSPPWYLLLVIFIIPIAIQVVSELPTVPLRTELVYSFDRHNYPTYDAPGEGPRGTYLLVITVVCLMLSSLSLLFPFPEIFILVILSFDLFQYKVGGIAKLPARQDFAERLIKGASGIWAGGRGLVWTLHAVSILIASLLIFRYGIEMVNISRGVDISFFNTLLTTLYLIMMIGFNVILVARFTERQPIRMQSNQDWYYAASENSNKSNDIPLRVPGLTIPSGMLFGAFILSLPKLGTSVVPDVTFNSFVLGMFGSALAYLSIRKPRVLPTTSLSDYIVTAISFVCFMISITIFINIKSSTIMQAVTNAGYLLVICSSPFLAYEISPVEAWERPEEAIVIKILIGFILLVIAIVVLLSLSRVLGGLLLIISIAVIGVHFLVALLYFSETYRYAYMLIKKYR